uniref:Uncharacterized protein n=1 Tax=Rhizophora mucronata TaxID=61149 RepID=A0A2P2R0F1_RHIMU
MSPNENQNFTLRKHQQQKSSDSIYMSNP